MLLNEVVAKASFASDSTKYLPLNPPFQKVVRAWGEPEMGGDGRRRTVRAASGW